MELSAFNVTSPLYYFIYSFHMPAFALLSGFLTKQKDNPTFWQGVKKNILVFATFYIYYKLMLMDLIYPTVTKVLTPPYVTWYLFSLITWRIMCHTLKLKQKNAIVVVFLALIAAIGVGYVSFVDTTLSLSRTFVFFPLFLVGYYVPKDYLGKVRNINNIYTISIVAFIATAYFYYGVPEHLIRLFHSNAPYAILQTVGEPSWLLPLLRFSLIVASLVLSVCIYNITPAKRWLAQLGRKSLEIYLFHGFAAYLLFKIYGIFNLHNNYFITTVLTVVILLVTYKFANTKMCSFVMHPF